MYNEVRTIKPTDHWIYEDYDSRMVSNGIERARAAVGMLQTQYTSLSAQLKTELASPNPNLHRVARIREILGNISQTLCRKQKQEQR